MGTRRGSVPLGVYTKGVDLSHVIVVKDFPSGLDCVGLSDYISKHLNIKTKAVYFHGDNRDVAMVLLQEPYRCDDKPGKMTVIAVDPPEGLIVDVPEGSDLTMLQAYFEGERSGVNGQFTQMDYMSGVLVIKIPKARKVLQDVFSKEHKLGSVELFIEPYYPAFHDECFQLRESGHSNSSSSSQHHLAGCWFDECQVAPSGGRLTVISSGEDIDSDDDEDQAPAGAASRHTREFPDSYVACTASDGERSDRNPSADKTTGDDAGVRRSASGRQHGSSSNPGSSSEDGKTAAKQSSSDDSDAADNVKPKTSKPNKTADTASSDGSDSSTATRGQSGNRHHSRGSKRRVSYRNRDTSGTPNSDTYEILKLEKFCNPEENLMIAKNLNHERGQDFLRRFEEDHNCKLRLQLDKEPLQSPVTCSTRETNCSSRIRGCPQLQLGQLVLSSRPCIVTQNCVVSSACDIPRGTKQSSCKNGVEIAVRLGDIAKEKADVIVNMIGPKKEFQESVISQALINVGGPGLVQDLSSADLTAPIIQTKGGNLQCKEVYTLSLDKWNKMSKQVLATVLDDCFQLCQKSGHQSISFPLLGVGRMLKFPLNPTASTMMEAAVSATANSGLKTITIVGFDKKAYDALVQELPPSDPKPVTISTDKGQTPEKKRQGRERLVGGSVTINAARSQLADLRRRLEEDLRQNYLQTETVRNPRQCGMPLRMKGRVYEMANTRGHAVCIEIDQVSGDVSLKGERKHVKSCRKSIEEFLSEKALNLSKTLKCSGPFWSSLAHEYPETPSYWTNFSACRKVADVFKATLSSKRVAVVPVDGATDKAVRQLVQGTWKHELVGHGRDAVNLNHTNIQVQKVERIENLDLFAKYAMKRQEFFRSLADEDIRSLPAINDLPVQNGGNVMTQAVLHRPLSNEIFPEINECYVFHGTKPEIIQTIIHQGLDFRMSSDRAMFGMGIYGAESSTKADQYADSKQNRTPGSKQMLILRMILGRSYICSDSNPKKYRRPPCTHPKCRRDDCIESAHLRYDSVVGDGQWLFREFVVYAADQCYPEFLVTYDRQ